MFFKKDLSIYRLQSEKSLPEYYSRRIGIRVREINGLNWIVSVIIKEGVLIKCKMKDNIVVESCVR